MERDDLDAAEVLRTLERLESRIERSFPGASLARVCRRLIAVAREAQATSERLARPMRRLRAGLGLLLLVGIAGLGFASEVVDLPTRALTLPELIQVAEAFLNEVLLLGAGLFFVFTLELRIKRGWALAALHPLRSIAHVIDMHQLAKDPEQVLTEAESRERTAQHLSERDLGRYLDYASEMLALVGKIAALYVRRFDDGPTLAAVSEIEELTTGLSRKIWQKITLLRGDARN